MTRAVHGVRKWGPLQVDEDGYREYKLGMILRTNDKLDGPYQMLRTPGTPVPGSAWSFGNDNDTWAFRRPEVTIERYNYDDSAVYGDETWSLWYAEYTFGTKPLKTCRDTEIENPLMEPYKYSGNYKNYSEEAYFDRFGFPLVNSAWEQFRGEQVEFDRTMPTIRIEQNVSNLQLGLLSSMINCVNDRAMWGLPPRTIRLVNAPWEKLIYGTCYYYFRRSLEFEINYETWDRLILDEGTAALNGKWHETTRHWVLQPINGEAPDRFNPAHFVRFEDFKGQPSRVILNGFGLPAGVCIDEYVPESFEDPFPEIYIAVIASGLPHTGGASLHNKDFWIQWKPTPTETAFAIPPNTWDIDKDYVRGNTVTREGQYYIALQKSRAIAPNIDVSEEFWKELGGLTNMGAFNPSTNYTLGQYVVEYSGPGTGTNGPCNTTSIGSMLVQKYQQANFLLLGVPLLLPV